MTPYHTSKRLASKIAGQLKTTRSPRRGLKFQVDRSIPVKPHPDEVDAVKWVSLGEMDAMMEDPGAWLHDRFPMSSKLGTVSSPRFLRHCCSFWKLIPSTPIEVVELLTLAYAGSCPA